MKTKTIVAAVAALMLSVSAFAQNQPRVHKMKADHSPEAMEARKTAWKDSLAKMTPAERKAFKKTSRANRQARLDAMTPEQRAKIEARREQRKATKKQ